MSCPRPASFGSIWAAAGPTARRVGAGKGDAASGTRGGHQLQFGLFSSALGFPGALGVVGGV